MIKADDLLSLNEPLSKISLDSEHNHSMVNSKFQIINFDKVKDNYAKAYNGYAPKSCDGLYYSSQEDIFYLIEFKNGKINSDVRTQIFFKILESLFLLSDIIGKSTACFRDSCKFILVYNDFKNRSNIASHISKNAGSEIIRFGLDRFEHIYLKKVHTISPQEFNIRFVKRWEKE